MIDRRGVHRFFSCRSVHERYGHSPEGLVVFSPVGTGVPNTGAPDADQLNFWARITRSQPGVSDTFE
jgi:hypothetical protein